MIPFPTFCLITEEPFDLNALTAHITSPTAGAVVIFTGIVRAVTSRGEPHETSYLEYEAYAPMAEATMRQIADEIRSHWPKVEGIALVQRIGRFDPGTPTTVVACAGAHRDSGVFEAARYGIERLKEIVPVWKKEVGPHGQEWVEGDRLSSANISANTDQQA
jgi:molybdopterin synthase catalytic subunit